MSRSIRAVIFDLDGTLLDTAPDFIVVVNQLRAQHQLPSLDNDIIRAQVSNGARALVKLALSIDESHREFEHHRQTLLSAYLQHIAVHTVPFAGIELLLRLLDKHNISWGIATNKPATYTIPLMAALNMQPAPFCVICPDHVSRPKPDPESLFLASKQLQCSPEEIIYVGDHLRDIECGKSAGCITIAAAYGYIDQGDSAANWQADHIVQSADEIWPIVQSYL